MKSIATHHKTSLKIIALLCYLLITPLSKLPAQNLDSQMFKQQSKIVSQAQYGIITAGFIKNAGQVYDYDKNLVPAVFYTLNCGNSSVFLTTSGLTYSLIERDLQKVNPIDNVNRSTPETSCADKNVARIDMELAGADIQKQNIIELEYVNRVPISIYGSTLNADALNLKVCRQIIIKNVYPQIDWMLKITADNKFKYDFIVHPGGNVNSIRIKYRGSKKMKLNAAKNELTVPTPLGNINEGRLFCYTEEDKLPVTSSYNLSGDTINFDVSTYGKTRTLVIDPPVRMNLTWSTYYGGGCTYGGGGSVCTAIKCDEHHNRVYVVGYCLSNPFPNYNNNVAYYFSPSQAGSSVDAFISAFDFVGVQQWASYYMSTDYDGAFDVSTDQLGNVYMVGITESHNPGAIGFLTQPLAGSAGSYCQSLNSGTYQLQDGFIVRFNLSGQLMWATLFGGNGTDQIYSVACDYNNNVFVSGLTWSQSQLQLLKPPSGYFQPSGGGAQSGLIAGFDVNAKLIWSTYFGNAGSDCRTITCDGNSNIYVAGAEGSSAGFPFASLPGAYNNCSDGYYVSVFCSGFKQKWCSSFQPGQYIRKLCASKSDGGLLVSGYSVATSSFQWNKDLNATLNSFFSDVYSGGNSDGFLTLLNPDYSIRWSTLFGSNGNDQITSAAITISGKIIVSGYTDNTANSIAEDFPLVPTNSSYFQNNLKAYNPAQIFVAAFDSKVAAEPEKLLWSTMVGDSSAGREIAYSMDVSGENLFIAGNAFLEPAVPSFPLVHEPNGFLQTASNPIVSGFNASGSNGLILKFNSEATGNLRLAEAPDTPQLYPNPCTDKFIYLKNDNNIYSDAIFQIHDASGRCIKQFNSAPSAGQQIQIDLEGLVKGYYTLSINKKNNNDHLKFMRL